MRTENDGSCSIIRTAATIFILAVVWIGYTAWPIYDLLVLVRAIETRDVHTVTRHVYFDAVRASLTNQIVAAYVQHTGIQIGPLAQIVCSRCGHLGADVLPNWRARVLQYKTLQVGQARLVVPSPQ
jgi:Protein of unknown function (DUF2939)